MRLLRDCNAWADNNLRANGSNEPQITKNSRQHFFKTFFMREKCSACRVLARLCANLRKGFSASKKKIQNVRYNWLVRENSSAIGEAI